MPPANVSPEAASSTPVPRERIRIRVLWFAALRERAGIGEREWISPGGSATVQQALDALGAEHPFLRGYPLAVAVNRRLARHDQPLRDGDELALLPPVSGG